MVATEREQNWIIYSLPLHRSTELERNLKCLQDCVLTDAVFKRDLHKLTKLRTNCCEPRRLFQRDKPRRRVHAKTKSSVYLCS